ncbi:MAG TPA: hypothetical protein VNY77_04570, partial [Candidatus Angelobacter sp.]|nr:hypothetical protein [Candidatus Angelobacter sp.]
TPPKAGQTASVFGTCRLPVMTGRTTGAPPAGWLEVPKGTFSLDQSSLELASATVVAWDAGAGRWVPTDPSHISPDGATYLSDVGSDIVDAGTGAIVHQISGPTQVANFAIGYTASAIYFVHRGIDAVPGLWKADISSGALTQVSAAKGDWELADDTAAWGVDTTANNVRTLRRLDLSTGVVTDVYTAPQNSREMLVAGFAGSGVLVVTDDGTQTLVVLVAHPDGSVANVDIPPMLLHGGLGSPNGIVQDGPAVLMVAVYPLDWPQPPAGLHGWGLAAYDPDHGLQLVATNTPQEMILLGRCMSV